MRSIILAFLLCSLAAGSTYFGLTFLGVDKDIAKLVSTLILGAFPKLREVLEKTLSERRGDTIPEQIKDLLNYKLNPGLAFLYATVSGYAAVQLGSFFGGLIGGMLGAGLSGATAAMGVVVAIFSLPILYLCGRWIGRRCRSLHYLVAVCAGVAMRAAAYWIDPLFVSPETMEQIYSGETNILTHFVYGAVLYSAVLVIGVFFGIKQQLPTYFGYLLQKLPRDTRVALVELAHDEAVRISKSSKAKAA